MNTPTMWSGGDIVSASALGEEAGTGVRALTAVEIDEVSGGSLYAIGGMVWSGLIILWWGEDIHNALDKAEAWIRKAFS